MSLLQFMLGLGQVVEGDEAHHDCRGDQRGRHDASQDVNLVFFEERLHLLCHVSSEKKGINRGTKL